MLLCIVGATSSRSVIANRGCIERRPTARRCSIAPMAASSSTTLVYFKGRGRAEQARWILAATETPFQHFGGDGLQSASDFQGLRDSGRLLFGQVPLLEIDGARIVQSQAIVRYVAARAGRLGQSPAERALADQVAEGCSDYRGGLLGFPFSADGAAACAQSVGRYAPVFEGLLGAAGGGFAAGGADWTYADVLLAEATAGYGELFGADQMRANFPALAAHCERTCALRGLKAYLASPLRFPFPSGDVGKRYVANVGAVLRG